MLLSLCLNAVLLSLAIVITSAIHDHQPLRQPMLYESECAKQWAKLSSDNSNALSKGGGHFAVMNETNELRVDLSVELLRFTSSYVNFNTRSYNGLVPAPTIKVCPGDRLVVMVINLLEPGESNDTNLHLHGMHLPPVGKSDDVLPVVHPGGQREYIYEIHEDHLAGTFWYHPHAHGNSNSQLNGMMAGTLIVADRPADFPTTLAAMDDVVMILQSICVESCFSKYDNLQDSIEHTISSSTRLSEDMDMSSEQDNQKVWPTNLEIVEDNVDAQLNNTSLPIVFVNGQYLPTLDLAAAEYKRLRFVNAIANNVAEIVTTRDSSCVLNLLAMDSVYFDTPKMKEFIVIPPGGRADVAIMCAKSGEFYLETDCASSRNKLLGLVNQHRVPSQRFVKLQVMENDDESKSDVVATVLPSVLPKRPAYMVSTIGSTRDAPVVAERNKYDFEFSVWLDEEGIALGVNHERLNMTKTKYSMPVNELQQWQLSIRDYRAPEISSCDLNETSSNMERQQLTDPSTCRTMSHPFHIHATHFQISDMDDDTDPDGVLFDIGDWRDTLPLFRGGVQIRFMPREYMVGTIFVHCHIASHVDAGMAQLVSVYDPRVHPYGYKREERRTVLDV